MVGHRMVHAADDRQTVDHPRRLGQKLADPDAGYTRRDRAKLTTDLRRCVRFHVEGVDVAGTAVEKDQNARADRRGRTGSRLRAEKIRKSQAKRAQAADLQQPTAVQARLLLNIHRCSPGFRGAEQRQVIGALSVR